MQINQFILQFSSVTQSCPTLCDPMNRSTPGLHVHHQLPEFTQTHVHRVGDAIQPSHSLLAPSLPVRWHHPYGRKWRRTKEPLGLFLGIKFSKQLCFYTAMVSSSRYPWNIIKYLIHMGHPRYLSAKESTCQCTRSSFDPWFGKIPWRREWQLTTVFMTGKFHA